MNKLNITKTCREALKVMLELRDGAHNVEHVVRVYDWCRKLAKYYPKCDLKVLKVAAYWHDVGRSCRSKDKDDHAWQSGRMVEEYLSKHQFPDKFIQEVKYTVSHHSFRFRPENIEGKILHDADKLSFIGDHELPDVFDGFSDGFESPLFTRQEMVKFLTFALKDYSAKVSYFYRGFILPEAKKIFKQREP